MNIAEHPTFGQLLRDLRLQAGLTQEGLAERAGLSVRASQGLERGVALEGVLAAQKVQLDAMSGFVETERMRRFGTLSESEQNMQRFTSMS